MKDLEGRLAVATGLSSAAPIEPVPVSPLRASIPSADALRNNADALRSWMNSVTEQQREARGMFGGGYGIERAASDALECSFRIASSLIPAMLATAEAIDHLAQAIETRRAETLGSVEDESAVPKECAHTTSVGSETATDAAKREGEA